MSILDFMQSNLLYLDGAMGTQLQARGLGAGELPERRNVTHAEDIVDIHRAYFDAGCHVVCTNTFGANGLKYGEEELSSIVRCAIENARRAAALSTGAQPKWVALDIGPTGRMLKPYGDLDFEDAVTLFSQVVTLGTRYGADLIYIETMGDTYEAKAALLAAKEQSTLPVFVSCAYGADGKLMTGASPQAVIALLEGMGADAIGVNCSLGPEALLPVVREYLAHASVPVLVKPNAGLPRVEDGRTVYDVDAADFAEDMAHMTDLGVRILGGCCGTTPDYLRATVERTRAIAARPITYKDTCCVSSYTHAVTLGERPVLIGERINPSGKKRFKQALREGDMDFILTEGLSQADAGAHILDVNVGLPDIDEGDMLVRTVCELQTVVDLPLQIDTVDPCAMERALRRYNGKAMINSVNGKRESMAAVLPLVKKYGGVVIALTLDEQGISASAERRVAIARKILAEAKAYGIEQKNIVFDPLAMAVSADTGAARETLRAVRMIREELGCHTCLGVSNVSFGLPARDVLSATFFTMALSCGLSAAIMNPKSSEMMKAYHAYLALMGQDASFDAYLSFAKDFSNTFTSASPSTEKEIKHEYASELQRCIVKGLKNQAVEHAKLRLTQVDAMTVVHEDIIPALNIVGEGFEKKTVFLPTLLMSAEAASGVAEVLREHLGAGVASKCRVVLATVKGDIHDIGKNIVKMILENYGFEVIDLGRDVPPEHIVREVVRLGAPIVGLSALMTTTVGAMEDTIRRLHRDAPSCRIMVGGAVLTQEYAMRIGADRYAEDAMAAVRCAEELYERWKGNEHD